ncbi:MAG TPA: UDP-glucose/GDP-mannose dehydrogenase family protein [archaeon]|nr:UDP-glucose/GDP-mannose dehydrogenase family protein [archaeon]
MKIAVIGTGYVGLVAGACFAGLGNSVMCADIDEKKIASLQKAQIPIYEPGLEQIVKKNIAEKRLIFTTDSKKAIMESEIIFIAVGTPQAENGQADLRYVMDVAKTIGENMNGEKIVVDKSTVPVGSAKKIKELISKLAKRDVAVVSNPEFLREGSAVRDFLEPDRVIIGSENKKAANTIADLYRPLKCEILITSAESAELIKYASNAFLATKISFINETANLCELVGADISEVAAGMGLDKRIGKEFLNAGAGYGGSCFPKDVKALQKISKDAGYDFSIIRDVEEVNTRQKKIPFEKLKSALGNLSGKKIAMLGLSFKPNTDDMREASSIEIANLLVKSKAKVVAVDPVAQKNASKIISGIEFSDSPYDAASGADALVLVTEWDEFKEIDFGKIAKLMKGKTIVDARNIYNPKSLTALGFNYMGIGRGVKN